MPDQPYRVMFEIDVNEPNPEAAVRRAWELLTGPEAMLPVGVAVDAAGNQTQVDLQEQQMLRDNLLKLIEAEKDCRRVVRLEAIGDGLWRYLMETTFKTYPKFVIGICDDCVDSVKIEFACGMLDGAVMEWERLHQGKK